MQLSWVCERNWERKKVEIVRRRKFYQIVICEKNNSEKKFWRESSKDFLETKIFKLIRRDCDMILSGKCMYNFKEIKLQLVST